MIEHYISLLTKAVFVENILLAYFLGMCSFLAISKKVDTSIGLGLAVIFVLTITSPVNWAIHHYFLEQGALSWAGFPDIDLSFLNFIVFIAVIAAMVQLVEMILDRYSPTLYHNLGIFLPLIAVNCAILGGSLFLVERDYTFFESTVFGFGSGLGWFLAIVSMAAIRYRLRYSNVPVKLRGLGITMLLTGLLSMAFMAFSGIDL
ncbi:MAG: NADH:ubiquinone reductase (Na(+)-transporting) subunit E [Candidatus Marinimicrobia bacterium]|jgi:Na+-transporting NADH:ubiquinone oxidoreductase subunit E|nr:NADH:ubiquinone reductase (Na(+)-transporting) subunit E [Candidatus Neomarinimicrobiota bacterium]MBT3948422.1 NADH:ubiquinone reductase (Na(+)-transporting) subunit E [Candidatus Neomarinimicrobiota bacterium]MBT4064806.1 NADH:ubiquinone reductase (Na(+)-transporting) subunit E [Candidatus Neomarinimicrobiota bacterium]MBT4308362.1 NADH:ubiquinone reductase (Na(+)-transporting) subunit E [Candidatus Neomarinimicrobiota bacterium]MBT4452895.1 NADH:ubiquinone reductase (Na(+)-transporting) s|tara:strand:+ start:2669 stop:3280 length:612 start_codon:yes stop_codon:yes gene_type:complete